VVVCACAQASAPELHSVPSYRFDLVDVGREVIAANFSATANSFMAAFASNSTVGARH
jgi:hypothetical protein